MKLMPFDVKREFTRLCGPDVTYVGHEILQGGRRLAVEFKTPAVEGSVWSYHELRNGTSWALRDATKACAKLAFDYAYAATGKRAADMAQLLKGKLA